MAIQRGHRGPATTQIESIPRPRLPIVSLDRDDRGDPLVRFTQYSSTGLNAVERYGLQKYRFPITDNGPSRSHRRSPTPSNRRAVSFSLPLGLDTETIQHARGRKRVAFLPPDPPVCYSPLSSVHPPSSLSARHSFPANRRTIRLFRYLRSSDRRSFFFLFFQVSIPVRSVCTTGPRV